MTRTTAITDTRNTFRRHTFRKDTTMQFIELRLADVAERQALLRSIRDAERDGLRSTRTLRYQVGQSLVRLGRRIGGEAMTSPAWQG